MSTENESSCYCRPGMTNEGPTLTQLPDGTWQAVAKIGSLFGSEVEGECRGTGATKEEALAALKKDQNDLYTSLW
mgnify:CR=1 FL=1